VQIRRLRWVAGSALCIAAAAIPAVTSAAGPFTCSGTFPSPGVLSGSYPNGVVVTGVCEVSAGQATVIGNIEVRAGGVLAAAFGRNFRSHTAGSSLHVTGGILALGGSTVILGCTPKAFVCLDGSGSSHETIDGGIDAEAALAVLAYNSTIGGDVQQRRGGGGVRCGRSGPFTRFGLNVYSTYQGDKIGGQFVINSLHSCFLAVASDRIKGTVKLISNKLANPDAIEVTSNHIGGNLVCFHNSHVWNSEGYHPTKAYPRLPERNTVSGVRAGQCSKATPTAAGQPGTGRF
jgi:hypothetical protein